jgi:hypothetical protein
MSKPEIKSFDELYGQALASFMADIGVTDVSPQSVTAALFKANALMTYRATGGILQVLKDNSLDQASLDTLKRIAKEENVKLFPASAASDVVTILDTSFAKLSTKVYSGSNAPNIGSTIIKVSNTLDWPSTGSIYIGRNTPNIEGPLAYTAITPVGGYYEITLSSPTTKFHNINETVILAQGGTRIVPALSTAIAPSSGGAEDIVFAVNDQVILLDGENELKNVRVTCQKVGSVGNVPRYAIKEFSNPPFTGASVLNEVAFTNGKDEPTDSEIRTKIKRSRLTKGLGSSLAIKNAVLGISSSEEAAQVVSNEIVTSSGLTKIIIDDGFGYERKTAGVGIEYLVDSALGGENNFQLATGGKQTSITKAFLSSTYSEPFNLFGGENLALKIGGELSQHSFAPTDFKSPGAATAYEVVASINSNYNLTYSASTINNGTQISLTAKTESNEDIQAVDPSSGSNAALLLGLPSNEVQTLRLYKNNQPLSRNGKKAYITGDAQGSWSNTILSGDTLILSVDGTDFITYTITNTDFAENTEYSTVSSANSLQSWVDVFNAKLTGITASIDGLAIKLTSNRGITSKAKINIDASSTLVSKGMFTAALGLSSIGAAQDYTFSRNTGQITLTEPLSPKDKLTVGNLNSTAKIYTDDLVGATVSILNTGYFWVSLDDPQGQIIAHGATSNSNLSVSKPSANTLRYTSSLAAFPNLAIGDYAIIWSEELNSNNRLEGRIAAKTSTSFDLIVTTNEYNNAVVETNVIFNQGLIFYRGLTPQKLKISSGTYNINTLANTLNSTIVGGTFAVEEDIKITLSSNTKEENYGKVLIVGLDTNIAALGFHAGQEDTAKISHIANYENVYDYGSYPAFVHNTLVTENYADPSNNFITLINSAVNLESLGLSPNLLFRPLNPYGAVDLQPNEEIISVNNLSGGAITLDNNVFLKRLRLNDRFFIAYPFDFGAQDTLVAILDSNPTEETFTLPLYRKATTNPTLPNNASNFNAYDTDSGLTASFSTYFGSSFKFNNYKALMQAKRVFNGPNVKDALLIRSKAWGKSGEYYNFGYFYPTSANQDLGHTITVGKDTTIKLTLKSGSSVSTSIDGTTRWNVSITPNTPVAGVDQVTFSWSGTGTNPNLTSLVGGEYVTIVNSGNFAAANLGTFRVSTEVGFLPTATSFTVVRKNGTAVSESNIMTLVNSTISFYNAATTTAAEINTYINDNMSAWLTSTIVDDAGNDGSGTIDYSTYEMLNFSDETLYLKDGLNWILQTNLSGSPQFTFKKPLTYITDTGYNFNLNEEVRLVPTTIKQLKEFLNTLAVSGFSTIGSISTAKRNTKLQLGSSILGSTGAIQIAGGSANELTGEVIGSTLTVDKDYLKTNIASTSINTFSSGQLLKLEAANYQKKAVGIDLTNSARIVPNFPSAGLTTFELANRQIYQRFFGSPRIAGLSSARTWKLEKQGALFCLSWNGSGSDPLFSHPLSLGTIGSSSLKIVKDLNSDAVDYTIIGTASFEEFSTGDKITFATLLNSDNNGTFIISGKSTDSKTIRINNSLGVTNVVTATINILSNANVNNDTFTFSNGITSVTYTAGVDFAIGINPTATAANFVTLINSLVGYSASNVGALITVTHASDSNTYSLVYNDIGSNNGATVTDFAAETLSGVVTGYSKVSEGDTVILGSDFNILNQGSYRVIRAYNNSIYIEGSNLIEEEVSSIGTTISFSGNGSSGYNLLKGEFTKLIYKGTGTTVDFSSVRQGDRVTIAGTTSSNGSYRIVNAEPAMQQKIVATFPEANSINSNEYWLFSTSSTNYYVWYNKNGTGIDPALVGKTGIEVAVSSGNTASQVAANTKVAIEGITGAVTITQSTSSLTITTVAFANTLLAPSEGTMVNTFSLILSQEGHYSFIEFYNASAVQELSISGLSLSFNRPSLIFYDYETIIPGDKLILGDTGLGNSGTYTVTRLWDQNKIILSDLLDAVEFTSLTTDFNSVYIEEYKKYTGYKTIRQIAAEPSNSAQVSLIFDTIDQASKINDSGAITLSTLNKFNYSTVNKQGLDSYRYDTGLLGETNRVIYGDPRDSITYPGVAAAGAEIFTDCPLIRRIILGINVRINTGIPFAQITEQIRSSVSALINSNPLGQSIAISKIIATVDAIPGVKALAISSPQYDSNNDLITIQPSEKSKILDSIQDILISQIG